MASVFAFQRTRFLWWLLSKSRHHLVLPVLALIKLLLVPIELPASWHGQSMRCLVPLCAHSRIDVACFLETQRRLPLCAITKAIVEVYIRLYRRFLLREGQRHGRISSSVRASLLHPCHWALRFFFSCCTVSARSGTRCS